MERAITVEEICKRLKPILGKKADKLYLKYAMAESRDEKEQIQRLMNLLYEKHLNTTLLEETILLNPPDAKIIKGEYPLGVVSYANEARSTFGLRNQDWPRHVCVTGMSGSGKTTFAFQILANFIYHKVPFIIFDWKKSFRPMINIDKEVMCFTVGNNKISNLFKTNINIPPKGIDPKEWVSILCDLIVESFFASYGVHKLLRNVLDQAFRDFGVYKGSKNYPTWHQIKDRLEEKADELQGKRKRESEWVESALRIADSLTFGGFGETVNSKDKYGFSIEELMDKKVIFELNTLGSAEKKFFCEFLLNYIYFTRKFNQTEYSEKFKNAIIVDEAHHIFLKDKPNFLKETVTEMIYRELREYGTSLICLDQHISKLSEVVAGNSATNIAFQQILPQDVDTISSLMQIREKKKFFSMLPVGQAIVKLAERYYEPFLLQVPNIDVKKTLVTDAVIKENMEEVVKLHKQKKVFIDRCKDSNIKKVLGKLDYIYKEAGVETKGDGSDFGKEEIKRMIESEMTIELNDEHIAFLKVLKKKPLPTTQTYKLLELSARKCDRIKNDLIANSLIQVEDDVNDKGRTKILHITERGLELIKK